MDAAPMATVRSGSISWLRCSMPKKSFRSCRTNGTRLVPPTNTTSSISSLGMSASFKRSSTGFRARSKRPRQCAPVSNSPRVTDAVPSVHTPLGLFKAEQLASAWSLLDKSRFTLSARTRRLEAEHGSSATVAAFWPSPPLSKSVAAEPFTSLSLASLASFSLSFFRAPSSTSSGVAAVAVVVVVVVVSMTHPRSKNPSPRLLRLASLSDKVLATHWSKSAPPSRSSPCVAITCTDSLFTNSRLTSKVPPPKSYTKMYSTLGFLSSPYASAAAVGSSMIRITRSPACLKASAVALRCLAVNLAGTAMTALESCEWPSEACAMPSKWRST
mmetsp:Transcript_63373/g.124467  ORF Transcript_63373/g.124467 Transcript_63373/m.124467 type:complete len:329 (-) Transcript_63373:642-1628(-)